jgi:hypothetical protein
MSTFRSPSRTIARAALAALCAISAAGAAGAGLWPRRLPFADGDVVRFSGYVTDAEGAPLPDLPVDLEASHPRFDIRTFTRTRQGLERRTTRTDGQGAFSFEWTWNGVADDFRLVAYVPIPTTSGIRRAELAEFDASHRLAHGSPVVTVLKIADASFVRGYRAFLAGLTTEDERRTWHEVGKPDTIDERPGGDGGESAWWYYAAGKVYRFRAGRLAEIEPFRPVETPR